MKLSVLTNIKQLSKANGEFIYLILQYYNNLMNAHYNVVKFWFTVYLKYNTILILCEKEKINKNKINKQDEGHVIVCIVSVG